MKADRDGVLRDTSLAYKGLQERHVENLRNKARKVLPPMFTELVVSTEEPFIQAIFDGVIPAMAFDRICIMGDAAFANDGAPRAVFGDFYISTRGRDDVSRRSFSEGGSLVRSRGEV